MVGVFADDFGWWQERTLLNPVPDRQRAIVTADGDMHDEDLVRLCLQDGHPCDATDVVSFEDDLTSEVVLGGVSSRRPGWQPATVCWKLHDAVSFPDSWRNVDASPRTPKSQIYSDTLRRM